MRPGLREAVALDHAQRQAQQEIEKATRSKKAKAEGVAAIRRGLGNLIDEDTPVTPLPSETYHLFRTERGTEWITTGWAARYQVGADTGEEPIVLVAGLNGLDTWAVEVPCAACGVATVPHQGGTRVHSVILCETNASSDLGRYLAGSWMCGRCQAADHQASCPRCKRPW